MKKMLFVLFFVVLTFINARSQPLALVNKLSILNDRIFLTFPDSAYNATKPYLDKATRKNEKFRTLIYYGNKKNRITFFAQELYKIADADFFTVTRSISNSLKPKYTELITKDGLKAMIMTPTIFPKDRQQNTISTMVIKTLDKSVLKIDVSISQFNIDHVDSIAKLSEHIFRTLETGKRRLNYETHTETFNIQQKKFRLKLPSGYLVDLFQGIDSYFLNINKVSRYGDVDRYMAYIYFGTFPPSSYEDNNFKQSDMSGLESGTILGKPVKWMIFKDDTRHLYIKQQQLPIGFRVEPYFINCSSIICSTSKAANEFSYLIASIKTK